VRGGFALLLVGLTASAGPARAQPRPSDAPVPSCLDQSIVDELGASLRPRGVQKRVFTKKGELALTASGGLFASDLLSSSYTFGGSLALFVTEDLGFEARLLATPVELDLDRPLAGFFGDSRFDRGFGYLATGGLIWSPIHAKLKLGDSIIHSDIMFAAGAGRMFGHDAVQGLAFNAGIVLDLFFSQWFTFRIDVRDVVMVQEAIAETRLTNNIVATAGFTLWIPTGL
jgi:outer membrane beta-barrel protein